jgi:hypothetical protein
VLEQLEVDGEWSLQLASRQTWRISAATFPERRYCPVWCRWIGH